MNYNNKQLIEMIINNKLNDFKIENNEKYILIIENKINE